MLGLKYIEIQIFLLYNYYDKRLRGKNMKKVLISIPDAMYEIIMKSGDSKNYLIKAIQNGEVKEEKTKKDELLQRM